MHTSDLLVGACSLARAAVPGLMVTVGANHAVGMSWALTAATVMHLPGFLSDLLTPHDPPIKPWLRALPVFAGAGLLFGVGAQLLSYTAAATSGFEMAVWLSVIPVLLLGLSWLAFVRHSGAVGMVGGDNNPASGQDAAAAAAAKNGTGTDTDPEAKPVPADRLARLTTSASATSRGSTASVTPSPAVMVGLAVLTFGTTFIAFGDGNGKAHAAGAGGVVLVALSLEILRTAVAYTRMTLFMAALPAFFTATVGSLIATAAGLGGGFDGDVDQGVLSWFSDAKQFIYVCLLAVGLGAGGVTVFGTQLMTQGEEAPSGAILRLVVLAEVVLGAVFAALMDNENPGTAGVIAIVLCALGTQALALLTSMNWNEFARQHQALGLTKTRVPPLLFTSGVKAMLPANRHAAVPKSAIKMVYQAEGMTGGSGGPDEMTTVANGQVVGGGRPPVMLGDTAQNKSSFVSLSHLETSMGPGQDPLVKLRSITPSQLPTHQRMQIMHILKKHNITKEEELESRNLPRELVAIAKHFLPGAPGDRSATPPLGEGASSVASTIANSSRSGSTGGRRSSLSAGGASASSGKATPPIFRIKPDAAIPESLDELDTDELHAVMGMLDLYNVHSREDLESAEMPEDIKRYLTNLVPAKGGPSSGAKAFQSVKGSAGETGGSGPRRNRRARRVSVTRPASTGTVDTSSRAGTASPPIRPGSTGVASMRPYRSPETVALTKKSKKTRQTKLAMMTAERIPGAVLSPTPKPTVAGIPKFTFEEDDEGRRSPFDAGVALKPPPVESDEDPASPWDTPKNRKKGSVASPKPYTAAHPKGSVGSVRLPPLDSPSTPTPEKKKTSPTKRVRRVIKKKKKAGATDSPLKASVVTRAEV